MAATSAKNPRVGGKKAEAALAKMATQRACVHVCHVPHALCDARHSHARVRALLRYTRYALCAAEKPVMTVI